MLLGIDDVRTDMKKNHVFKRDWTTCSKYANHSKFNSQHD